MIIPRKWPETIWSWYNLKFDAIALVSTFFICILILTLIELKVNLLFDLMPRKGCCTAKSKNKQRLVNMIKKDKDVIKEENRVSMMR